MANDESQGGPGARTPKNKPHDTGMHREASNSSANAIEAEPTSAEKQMNSTPDFAPKQASSTPSVNPPSDFSPIPEETAQQLAEMSQRARQNLDLTLERLPNELKILPNWVLWRLEARQNKSGDWKITKEPYIAQVDNPKHAASNRPQEWRTLQVALTVLKQDWARKHGGFYDGLGFMFGGSGYTGIDLDNVLTAFGEIREWADKLLSELGPTYIERSVSGTGLHVFIRGTFTGGGIKQKFADGSGFEMYCDGRYFTVTGMPGQVVTIAQKVGHS